MVYSPAVMPIAVPENAGDFSGDLIYGNNIAIGRYHGPM